VKILILGAGVIGTTYGWQLSNKGHQVTLFVRQENRATIEQAGIHIRYRDQRKKQDTPTDVVYRTSVTDELLPQAGYELIIVSVRAHQLDKVLLLLADNAGKADVLFFGNNWCGDERIRKFLPADQYLFGLSRLVGGWRTGNQVECIFFDTPGLETMLGEKDGRVTPRLQGLMDMFQQADLRPAISHDILGWLAIHYMEFLGAIGGILKAGSVSAFAHQPSTVQEAILATREGLDVCRARGIDLKRAAPANIRLIDRLPVFLLRMLVQQQYRTPSIQQFFEENIAHGMDEISCQYDDVVAEGKRLQVKMPYLEGFEKYYAPYRDTR
jgi:ketopantoate reductase